ncbi:hypothetical protein K2F40_09155 [Clostridium sp. CM028]|uniref:hypothetical protein n=1 Tax=Clostridium sp. CM028 TaxID=2851575 RepID=UPI001C6EDE8C|nr:hypothetical protein [Clostridium sp. CM028]MBW9149126.1 hypothetical protein [Clostridium sp. CM028]WLC62610.1 hypothetical protein KTC94_04895 [Clostridium sp. CM028]
MQDLKARLIESIMHSIIIMIISLFITYLIIINLSNIFWMSMISIIGAIFLIIYIKKPYDKECLIINSWLCMIFAIFIGILIGKIVPLSNLIGVGIGIPVFDIISFMKIGSKTTNAKVMSNKNLMSKLIVYGKSFKNNNPIPTKGLGDFLFYTILLSGIYKVSNDSNFVFYGACLIFLGCAINWIIVCFIYNKKWYKGFPATFIPLMSLLPLFLKLVN